jgi:hypothetical protein
MHTRGTASSTPVLPHSGGSIMCRLRSIAVGALVAVACTSVLAREPRSQARESAAPPQDMLAAEAAGLVSIKFIPNDARSAQVIVTNKSDRPLTLRLPDGFAGVPVLAQFMNQQGAGGGAGFGAGGIGGVPQNVGGGGQQNAGMGIGGGGGGPFSLPPERTRTLRVPTVCLEYGKREPTPRIEYKMTALETCSGDPRVQDVMTALASGMISQKVAQAAAWHLSSGRTWEQLASEVITMAGGDPDVPMFTPAELAAAHRLVDEATRRHPAASASPGESAAR